MTDAEDEHPPLRILTVCSALTRGGLLMYAVDLARDLSKRGHSVVFMTRAGSGVDDALKNSPTAVIQGAPRSTGDVAAIFRVAAELRRGEYDLLHGHFSRDFVPLTAACVIAGVPCVFSRHVLFPASIITRGAMRRAARTIACSQAVERVLTEELGVPRERVGTVRSGIDTKRVRPVEGDRRVLPTLGIPADVPVFGMVSRLVSGKRCTTFLHAAALTHRHFPQARFLLVGDGPQAAELRRLAAELSLEKAVILAGFRQDAVELMAELTALVQPSEGEAMSLVIIEALASGVPVIATRVGGNPEVVVHGKSGFLFDLDDTAALSEAMNRLAADTELAREMGASARQFAVTELDRETMLARMEEELRKASRNSQKRRELV